MATIPGTSGADTLPGTDSDDVINGLGGNDKIDGGKGNDAIDGGDGADIIKGGEGDDTITGGAGSDNIVGGAGRDTAVYATAIAAASTGGTPIGTWSGALLTLATGAEGVDVVNQVETLRFNGMDFAVAGYNGTTPYNVVANLGADSASGNQDNPITGNVLANDYDVDSRLAVTGARSLAARPPEMPAADPKAGDGSPGIKVGGQFGTLTLFADGNYSYVANGSGTDHFEYSVIDGGVTRWVKLDITAAHVNHTPDVGSEPTSGDEDTVITGEVFGKDKDGDPLTFSLVSGPAHGSLDFHSDGTYSYTPDADFNGSDSFTFKANDGSLDSETATVDLTVNPVNDAPVIDEDAPVAGGGGMAFNVDYPGVITFEVTGNAVGNGDPQSAVVTAALDVTAEQLAALGVSSGFLAGLGSFVGATIIDIDLISTPGSDGLEFTFDLDAASADSKDTVAVTLNGSLGLDYVFAGPGDWQNGLRISGSTLHFQIILLDFAGDGGPSTLTISNSHFHLPGDDFFADGLPLTITIGGGGAAPVEDQAFSGHFHASDVEGDILTFSLVDGHGPAHGSATVNSDGSFTYTPDADYSGSDSFQYQVDDGHGGTDTATYSFEVAGVNDAPVAADGSASGEEDSVITGQASASDVDGDSLTYSLSSGPSHGALTFNADGSFTYTPQADYTGPDSFTWQVDDGHGGTDAGTISLDVNPPVNDAPVIDETTPVATAATFVGGPNLDIEVNGHVGPVPGALAAGLVSQSGSLYGDDAATAQQAADAAGVTLDYITGAGDFLGATIVTFNFDQMTADQGLLFFAHFAPSSAGSADFAIVNFGHVHLDSRTSFGTDAWDVTFNPVATSGLHGSITLVLLDYAGDAGASRLDISNLALSGNLGQTPLRASILGAPVEDNPFTGQFHASDAEGDALTFSLVSGPAHGSASVNSDGSFTYVPDADYNGSDSFTYQVSDGNGGTDTATYSFDVAPVNDNPTADFDQVHVDEDGSVFGTLSGEDIDGDALTFTLLPGGHDHGSFSLQSDGTYIYTPDADFSGYDFVYYRVSDGHGGSFDSNLVLIVDGVNDAPTVADDSGSGDEDNSIYGQVQGTDPDGDSLTYELVGPAPAGLTFNADGTWSFDPTGVASLQALTFGQSGSASFSYRAYDGHLYSSAATVTVHVDGINEPIFGTAGKDGLTGTAGADVIDGLGGDDTIKTLGGADQAHGGDGADKLYGGDGEDRLWGDDGTDTVNGEGGDDVLFGGGGADTLDGGDGDDFVYGDVFGNKPEKAGPAQGDTKAGLVPSPSGDGADVVKGGAGNDHVYGGGGSDDVQGGAGDDFVYGGAGADRLSGGTGADAFVFLIGDLGGTLATSDTVTDFKASQGDWLDFSNLDANTSLGGDQAFSIVSSFGNHAGEMTVAFNAGINATVVSMDTNGDGTADYVLQLSGNVGSTAGWVL